jgi:hypothetical protein
MRDEKEGKREVGMGKRNKCVAGDFSPRTFKNVRDQVDRRAACRRY